MGEHERAEVRLRRTCATNALRVDSLKLFGSKTIMYPNKVLGVTLMPRKLDWQDRHLFVATTADIRRCERFCDGTVTYERAMARCPTAKSFTTVRGRKLAKDEIAARYGDYVRKSGFSFRDISKKKSGFIPWAVFVRSRPITVPLRIWFCSNERPLCIFHKCTATAKLVKLTQAIEERLPYVIRIPWTNSSVCFFGKSVWSMDANDVALELADLRLLILDRIDRERLKFEALRRRFAEQAGKELDSIRKAIPESTRMYVWRRDEGKCVICGSQERLEFDHIIPFCKGGSSTDRNIQLLCERCNRAKKDQV
jgi:hypothetical protein